MWKASNSHRAARLIAACCALFACVVMSTNARAEIDQPTLVWMQSVMGNWEAVCRRHLRIPVQPAPWVIFYDQTQAWHLNPERQLLPTHEPSTASLKFAGQTYPLLRVANSKLLWVPGRAELVLKKPTAVAMPYADGQKSFCIIPLPALFHTLAADDQAAELDELFLGLAMHELTHTRQLGFIMKHLNRLQDAVRGKLPTSIDDDLIENTFGQNEDYKRLYMAEQRYLFDAIRAFLADDLAACRQAVAQALAVSQQRKRRFFVGDKRLYSEFEDIFLALEGVAMWTHYQMALDRAPAGQDWLTTLGPISARTDSWSQAEGGGLFMLIDRLVPGWQARFLAPNPPSPFTVLREALAKRPSKNTANNSH